MKKPNHRIFDYTPRFYNPEEDEELQDLERRKRRLGFRNTRVKNKVKNKRQIYYIILFAAILYLYFLFSGKI